MCVPTQRLLSPLQVRQYHDSFNIQIAIPTASKFSEQARNTSLMQEIRTQSYLVLDLT